jgi:hypothetical protein
MTSSLWCWKWSSKPLRKRENRAVVRFSKPSAGLEPATPPLPWQCGQRPRHAPAQKDSVWVAASGSDGSIAHAWRCSRLSTSAVRGAPCADSQAIIATAPAVGGRTLPGMGTTSSAKPGS